MLAEGDKKGERRVRVAYMYAGEWQAGTPPNTKEKLD